MATPELSANEEYTTDHTRIFGVWDGRECLTYVSVNGQSPREFVLEIDGELGCHVDFLAGDREAPPEENQLALMAIAGLSRIKSPDTILIEDPDGNLL